MSVRRPSVVAFDVIETLFSLAPVADALRPHGVGVDLFFARLLRDGFAHSAAGSYRPFRELARSALAALCPGIADDAVAAVINTFAELPAHPDAKPAVKALVDQDLTVVTLTNGSADTTRRLLDRAGLAGYVAHVVSVDEASAWKPAPHAYRRLVELLGRDPSEVAMVAVHAWDIHGAHHAGLTTAWACRFEGRYPPVFEPPDISGPDLVAVAQAVATLPG